MMHAGIRYSDHRGTSVPMVEKWFPGMDLPRRYVGVMTNANFANAVERMGWYETHCVDELTLVLEQLARRNDAGR